MLAFAARPRTAVLLLAVSAVVACGGVDPSAEEHPGTDLASQSAAVVTGPDLIILSVGGPPSSLSGASFQVTVTMCNQGTDPATAPAGIYLSTDSFITTADVQIGQTNALFLPPGTCAPVSTPGGAFVPNGIYYVGA